MSQPTIDSPRARWMRALAVGLCALSSCGNPDPGRDRGAAPGDDAGAGCEDSRAACGPSAPLRAPLRRLTRFEYNNTVRDLFGDTTQPADLLPAEQLGNGFGNDADALSVSALLVEQYDAVAENVANRATATPEALAKLAPCAATVSDDGEEACTRTILASLVPKVFRRPLLEGESDDFLALTRSVRPMPGATFATAISALIQALLQSPEFLYRPELGEPDASDPSLRRPTGYEMAARLSYFLWGTAPDDELRAAAEAGALSTDAGVRAQAERLLSDARSRAIVHHFFDHLLPITGLTDLARDPALYPAFSAQLGSAMRTETQTFLAHVIFEGEGTWPAALTAPYTFVDQRLAELYGMTGVSGDQFRKVQLPDPTRRLGLLLQAGILTGTIPGNQSNPVLRGSFIANKLMCLHIDLPTDPEVLAQVQVPEDTSGATARERFSKHSEQAVCASCHRLLDPAGFALENFDAIGQYRERENGVLIDARGSVPGGTGGVSGPVELVRALAASEAVQRCFATHWMDFAYGRTLGAEEPATQAEVQAAFQASGYDVKELLLALTQTDAFLYLPASTEHASE